MTDKSKLALAVNQALSERSIALARAGLLHQGQGLDSKRLSAWCEYGFKESLSFRDFYNLYRRGGIAHGAVNKVVATCWRTAPWLIEGEEQDEARPETAWERATRPVLRNGQFWKEFKEADKRRLVGRYSALLLHFKDDREWHQPVARGKALERMTPVWESALQIKDYAPKTGEPAMWSYTTHTTQGAKSGDTTIHPDRLFILGDWSKDAIGYLEPAYNNFVSLEKVEGGSGESFLKNASRQMNINFDPQVNLEAIARAHGVGVGQLQEIYDEVTREVNQGNDSTIVTQGATVTPLVATVPDPNPTYNVNLQSASAALNIPTKILVGMQTGERASTEDQIEFRGTCQSRRENELNHDISALFEHLMRVGTLGSAPEYTVMWDDLTEATREAKLGNAKVMTEINAFAMSTGAPLFTDNEIRAMAGFDPVEEFELDDVDDDHGDDEA